MHERLRPHFEVSVTVVASTNERGYREIRYDLGPLAGLVDRFVLTTYDKHGPWTGRGMIGSRPWTERVVRAAERPGVPADRIDLGIARYSYRYVSGGSGNAQVSPTRARELAGVDARESACTGEWSGKWGDGRDVH